MRAVTVLSTAFAVCAATAIVTANRPAETPFAAIDTALSCQAKVVDKVRKDAGGKVFLTFDRMPSIVEWAPHPNPIHSPSHQYFKLWREARPGRATFEISYCA